MSTRAVRRVHAMPQLPDVLLPALLVMTAGFVAMTSASIDIAARSGLGDWFFVRRYGFHLCLALVLAALVYRVPLAVWQRSSWVLLLLGFVLLAVVLVPGIGKEVNGSRRWLAVGPLSLQASEFVKLAVIFYMADYLVRRRDEVREHFSGFLKPMLVLFLLTLLLMMEPDFGATVVTAGTAFVMIFLGGVRLWQFALVASGCLAGLAALILMEPYRLKRLTTFQDPFQDPFGDGYQPVQAMIAFGRGEWTGVGLGNSVQKLFYLPEAHTDFVFAIWAEEFGFIGVAVAIGLFTWLLLEIFRVGRRAETADQCFAGLVAYGIAVLMFAQIFINIGVNSGLLPPKGLTLPFWSYGGSSLMVSFAMLAVVLRIDRESREVSRD